jgi:hypothetical protein
MAQGITLDSLEETEFHLHLKEDGAYLEILKHLLSIPSLRKLTNVKINVSYMNHPARSCNKIYKNVRRMCPSNIGVELKCVFHGRYENQTKSCRSKDYACDIN